MCHLLLTVNILKILKGFNPFDINFLSSKMSKCYMVYLLVLLSFFVMNSLKNAFVDFVNDTSKQFSALITVFVFTQVCRFQENY